NDGVIDFNDVSTAGNATIHTLAGGMVRFHNYSKGGEATFVTDAGGIVDFSNSTYRHVTAGAIEGDGAYDLGADQLTVGATGSSATVSGPISDGGAGGGLGGALVKVGNGALTLSHGNNTYSGGTMLMTGILDIAAIGAAGPGAITFAG